MYHGMPFDPKLRVVARRAKQPMGIAVVVWACLLDAASQADPRGIAIVDAEEIAVALDFEVVAVESILSAMQDKEMIDEDGCLTAWDKRQHTTSTERMRKQRAKKKGDVTGSDTKRRRVTRRDAKNGKNAPDTEEITDADSEKNTEVDADLKKDSDQKLRARAEKRESEREKRGSGGQSEVLQQMADIWNEEVQSKITPDQKAILTAKRKELLAARWIDDFAEDIRAWRYFCDIIGRSDFCLGRLESKDWTIDLTWAIQSSDRVAKILEGGFSGGNHPPKPPSCELPELVDAWDEVTRRMVHHHGAAAIRSWFSNTVITAASDTPDGVMLTLEVPSAFVRGWIEQNYLADLNHCWGDAACSRSVIGVELTIREAANG